MGSVPTARNIALLFYYKAVAPNGELSKATYQITLSIFLPGYNS